MPNTVVTKLVTHSLANPTSLHHCDGNIVVGVSVVGCRRGWIHPGYGPPPFYLRPLFLPAPGYEGTVSGCGCCQALSSPPPLLHLLSGTSFPPLLHPHQTVIQDRRCSLRATLADWFPFLGALRAPWPVQVFPAADTGQYWFSQPLGSGQYWFSYRFFRFLY